MYGDLQLLPLAASAGDARSQELARLLKSSDVDVNACDPFGRSALELAASRGAAGCVHLLLRHRADPNARNRLGRTPLHAACVHAPVHIDSADAGCALALNSV